MDKTKTLNIIVPYKRNKTKTKKLLVGFEPSSLFMSESGVLTSALAVLTNKLHNKNVKIREKKGEQQQKK